MTPADPSLLWSHASLKQGSIVTIVWKIYRFSRYGDILPLDLAMRENKVASGAAGPHETEGLEPSSMQEIR